MRNVGSDIRCTLCPRGRTGNLSSWSWRPCAARSAGYADSDRRACHCLSWMVVGPGHRLRDWVSRRSLAAGTIWSYQVGEEMAQGCCKVGNTKKLSCVWRDVTNHPSSHERTPTKMTTISQRLSFPALSVLNNSTALPRSTRDTCIFHFPKMLTARATSIPATVREISASIIMSVFAALVSGYVSAGLSAVAPVKATNR